MIHVRRATASDARACHELDVLAWGRESAASAETLLARIQAYAAGNHVAVDETTGDIVGSIWTVAGRRRPITSWWEASGQGRYLDVCDPAGDFVFGVSVAMHPQHDAAQLLAVLIGRVVELARAAGQHQLMFGVPIKDFHFWHRCFAVLDYVNIRRSGAQLHFRDPGSGLMHVTHAARVESTHLIDPRSWDLAPDLPKDAWPLDANLARFGALSVGQCLPVIGQPLAGYFRDDASLDFGVEVCWRF